MTATPTPTPSSRLLNCPFCGNMPSRIANRVWCVNCYGEDNETACMHVDNWNRRAAGEMPVEVRQLLEQVYVSVLPLGRDYYTIAKLLEIRADAVESLYPRAGQEEAK